MSDGEYFTKSLGDDLLLGSGFNFIGGIMKLGFVSLSRCCSAFHHLVY